MQNSTTVVTLSKYILNFLVIFFFLLLLQTTVYIENFEEFLQKDIKTDCFANTKPNKKRKKVTFGEGENVFYEDSEPYSPMKKSRIDDTEDKDEIAAIVI